MPYLKPTKMLIATNYVNGNHSEVLRQLRGPNSTATAANALAVYETLRGQFSQAEALSFSSWLGAKSTLKFE